MIRRRDFITLVGGAAAAWPISVRAQQPGRLPTIGFLGSDATAWSQRTAAFVQRLRDLGWVDGRTVAIEYRWSEGRPERVADIAADLVRLIGTSRTIVHLAHASKSLKLTIRERLRRMAELNDNWPTKTSHRA